HARPEEIAQPTGQLVIRQWLHRLSPDPYPTPPRGEGRRSEIEAVAEMRRQEHADERIAQRLFVPEFVLSTERVIKSQHVVPFGSRQRPTVGSLGELHERLEMARLGGEPGTLDLANVGRNVGEISLDRLYRLVAGSLFARLRQVRPGQTVHH